MRRYKFYFFECVFFLLTFTSCYKIVNIELPEVPPTLVVNSLITSNENIYVYVSSTKSPYDIDDKIIEDALVIIKTEHNNIDTLCYVGDDIYESNLLGINGLTYYIEVFKDGYNKVNSSDYIPNTFICNFTNFTDSVGIGSPSVGDKSSYYSKFDISINDNGLEKNFYEVYGYLIVRHKPNDIPTIWHMTCFSSDLIIKNEGFNDLTSKSLLFSDELFNGENRSIEINYYPLSYSNNTLVDPNYSAIVCVRNVSENYFNYKKDLAIHSYGAAEFDFWSVTGNPVPMSSNIKDGYGVFAGYTEIMDTICKAK